MSTRTASTTVSVLMLLALSGCDRPSAGTSPPSITRTPAPAAAAPSDADLLARGEYLVRIAGCNDCHTPGYAQQQGNIDKSQWLTGDTTGFMGPWGTTYPINLRLKLAGMDEAAWLQYSANLHTRPVMPDFNVRAMTQDDRRAIYRFVHSLGPAGHPAPAYLPPGQKPAPPYMELVLPPGPPPHAPTG